MLMGASGAYPAEITMREGCRILLDPRRRTEADAYSNGIREPNTLAFLKACVAPGNTVFDIGANIGLLWRIICEALEAKSWYLNQFKATTNACSVPFSSMDLNMT